MKIRGLHIDGFGVFNDMGLEDLSRGLTVFLGSNEAGKSTCLAFFRHTLFGFPDGRSKEPAYEPLRGGTHGGRLFLEDDAFGAVTLERGPGKSGGTVRLTVNGAPADSNSVLPQVLGSASRTLFCNIYAFSLDELQTLDTLQDDQVKGAIYAASVGVSAKSLPAAVRTLGKQKSELFKQGGQKPVFNKCLAELEDLRQQLREASAEANRYEEYCADRDRLSAGLEQSQERRRQLQSQLESWEVLLEIWEDWVKLQQLEQKLCELPEDASEFPPDGLSRFEKAHEQKVSALAALDKLRRQCDDHTGQLQALEVDETLLKLAPQIRCLHQQGEVFRKSIELAPRLEANLDRCEADLRRQLTDLGPDWTPERVRILDRSLFTRDRIRSFKERLRQAADLAADRERTLAAAETGYGVLLAEAEEAAKRLALLEATQPGGAGVELEAIRNRRDVYQQARADRQRLTAEMEWQQRRIAASLPDVDPEWTVDQAVAFDTSRPARQAVELAERDLEQAAQAAILAESACAAAETAVQAAEERLARRQQKLAAHEAVSEGDLARRKETFRQLRRGQQEQGRILSECAGLSEEWDRTTAACAALQLQDSAMVVVIAVLVAGLVVALRPPGATLYWALASVLGAMCVALAVIRKVMARKRFAQSTGELSAKKQSLEKRREELDRLIADCHALLQSRPHEQEDLDQLEDRLGHEQEDGLRCRRLQEEIGELQADLSRLGSDRDARNRTLLEKRQDEAAAVRRWRDQVRAMGFSRQDLTPKTVCTLFDRIADLRGICAEKTRLEGQLAAARSACQEYETRCGAVPELAQAAAQDRLVAAVDDYLARADQHLLRLETERDRALAAQQKAGQSKTDLPRLRQQADQARAALAACKADWCQWLEAHSLEVHLEPDTALEAVQAVERCDQLVQARDRARAELEQERATAADFRSSAAALLALLGREPGEDADLPARIIQLEDELSATKENQTRKQALQQALQDLEAQLAEVSSRVRAAEKQLAELRSAAKVQEDEAFRRRAQQHARFRDLSAQLDQTRQTLVKIAHGRPLEALRGDMSAHTYEEIRGQVSGLREQLSVLDAELEEVRDRRADLKNRIDNLASATDVSRLRFQEASQLAELREIANRWARAALAEALLQEARSRFEKNRQPDVIRDASGFFRTLTNGRYQDIMAPVGEESIEVIDAHGRRRPPDALSRGTAEQLYLALRFGYITHYARHRQSLPVIMDDILVNFDPQRARAAAGAIRGLAAEHQVIFFTCHPATAELLTDHGRHGKVVTVADGAFSTHEASVGKAAS